MSIFEEINQLVALVNSGLIAEHENPITASQVKARLDEQSGPGTLEIDIMPQTCIVLANIEFFGIDTSRTRTIMLKQSGDQVSPALNTVTHFSGPILYVFQSKKAELIFAFTPLDDNVAAFARVRYYILPERAQKILSRCAMR